MKAQPAYRFIFPQWSSRWGSLHNQVNFRWQSTVSDINGKEHVHPECLRLYCHVCDSICTFTALLGENSPSLALFR